MASNIFDIDFTNKDYTSLVEAADAFATDLVPEWTARDDNDINWATIKIVAYLVSVGMFYIDLGANETDPFEVQIYRNALRLARKFGMPVKMVNGGMADVTLVIDSKPTTYTVSRGTEFFTDDGKSYILTDDATFPSDVVNPETEIVASLQYGEFERYILGTSDGSEFQSFSVERDDVQDKAVRIFIDEGSGYEEWTQQDTLLMSEENSKHFRLYVDKDEKYVVSFGDNRSGAIPLDTSNIEVEVLKMPVDYEQRNYGNLPAGNITSSSDSEIKRIEDYDSEAFVGGSRAENAKEIGRAIPQWIATAARAVIPDDYIFLGKRVGGVQDISVYQDELTMNLYIIPTGGGTASSSLQGKVLQYLDKRKLPQINVNTLVPSSVAIDTTIAIEVKSDKNRAATASLINDAIAEYLNQPTSAGVTLTLRGVYDIINSYDDYIISGIVSVFKKNGDPDTVGDIELNYDEVPEEGTITLTASGGIV
jgi:hypothetical protein